MNRYKLKMKTLTGLGNEYVYVYATSGFDRYLDIHNLKYARDMTKDYQLTDRFEELQQENQQLKDRINKAIEYIKDNFDYREKEDMFYNADDGYQDELKIILEILKGNNE